MKLPFVLLLAALLSACTPPADSAAPGETGDTEDTEDTEDTGETGETGEVPPSLALLDRFTPASGSFGRVLLREPGFLLGLVNHGGEHMVLGFDQDWQTTGVEQVLSEHGPREPDMELADTGHGLFHARLTKADGSEGLELRRLDAELAVQATTGHLAAHSDERALDVSLLVHDDRVWLGSEYREDGERWSGNIPPEPELERGLLLRELSLDLELLATHRLTATIPDASPQGQFWGLGAAQLRDHDAHWVFAAAASGATEYFDQGESAGTRRIWALEYDLDLELRAVHGPLTPPDQDAYWCTGAERYDDLLLLSYTFRRPEDGPVMGPPQSDRGNIGLVLADEEHGVLQRLELTDHDSETIAQGYGAHRSSITLSGERAWVSWDDSGAILVQELALVQP